MLKDINFGSQIRSYVLQPYTMVKDNRTNKDVGNAASVLDGNIDPFINAYLNWISTGKKEGKNNEIYKVRSNYGRLYKTSCIQT